MELSVAISIVSVLVSVGAVAYARATVRAAERANEIAIHADRLRTFHGVVKLKQKIQRSGRDLSTNDVFDLYDHFEVCEFYFTPEIYTQAMAFFDATWNMTRQNELVAEAAQEGEESRKEQIRRVNQKLDNVKALGDKVEEEMKKYLRLAK